MNRFGMAAVATLVAVGCATTPAPTDAIAAATAAVAQADRSGASTSAPAEMRAARDKLARVDRAMAAKNHRYALRLAQEALVDAELAEIKARSARATKAVP